MDWSAIIVGILAVLGSYLSNVALTRRKSREAALTEAEHQAILNERMKSIERKLDEHNHYAEKLTSIEKSMVSMQKDIEYLRKETS